MISFLNNALTLLLPHRLFYGYTLLFQRKNAEAFIVFFEKLVKV